MNKSVLYILLLTVLPFFLSGCKKKVRPTTMVIKDSVRHYYPIKQGQQLDIMFTITNTGDAPLVISDIQPSCGCIILIKVHISSFRKRVSDNSRQPTTVLKI